MKEHFCPAEQSMIAFEKECNWCGEQEALAQTQEPDVKLKTSNMLLRCHRCGCSDKLNIQIEYTTPPQRTWVGLTDEDICMFSMWLDDKSDVAVFTAIEAKLKELNT